MGIDPAKHIPVQVEFKNKAQCPFPGRERCLFVLLLPDKETESKPLKRPRPSIRVRPGDGLWKIGVRLFLKTLNSCP